MNNKGFLNILLAGIVVVVLVAGGYWFWQNENQDTENDSSPTPTTQSTSTPKSTATTSPTQIPTPTLVSTNIEEPSNLSQWNPASEHENYNWSFKYPPTWSEETLSIEASADHDYYPTSLNDGQFTTVFTRIVPNAASISKRVVDKGSIVSVVKRESFTVDGKSAVMVVNERETEEGRLLEFSTTIDDVELLGIDGSGTCIGSGTLVMENLYYNAPDFTENEVPYESDIKNMLSTFSFESCIN